MRCLWLFLLLFNPGFAFSGQSFDLIDPAKAWRCSPKSVHNCEQSGCAIGEDTGVYLKVFPKRNSYERCDNKGCDVLRANFSISGSFMTLTTKGRPTFVRMTEIAGVTNYTEVVGLLMGHTIYYGNCVEIDRANNQVRKK